MFEVIFTAITMSERERVQFHECASIKELNNLIHYMELEGFTLGKDMTWVENQTFSVK